MKKEDVIIFEGEDQFIVPKNRVRNKKTGVSYFVGEMNAIGTSINPITNLETQIGGMVSLTTKLGTTTFKPPIVGGGGSGIATPSILANATTKSNVNLPSYISPNSYYGQVFGTTTKYSIPYYNQVFTTTTLRTTTKFVFGAGSPFMTSSTTKRISSGLPTTSTTLRITTIATFGGSPTTTRFAPIGGGKDLAPLTTRFVFGGGSPFMTSSTTRLVRTTTKIAPTTTTTRRILSTTTTISRFLTTTSTKALIIPPYLSSTTTIQSSGGGGIGIVVGGGIGAITTTTIKPSGMPMGGGGGGGAAPEEEGGQAPPEPTFIQKYWWIIAGLGIGYYIFKKKKK
jgi:hypothetical protein